MPPKNIFTFQRTIFEIDSTRCFVLMPFTSNLNEIYWDIIKPTIETLELKCIRADEIYSTGTVLEDIWTEIQKARIIIVDLTERNPNVFYELGLAHTLHKPVVLLAQNVDDIPFDLRPIRHILYRPSPRGAKELQEKLTATIQNFLEYPLPIIPSNDITTEMKTRIIDLDEKIRQLELKNNNLTRQVHASSMAATILRQHPFGGEKQNISPMVNFTTIAISDLPSTFVGWDGSEYILVSEGEFRLGSDVEKCNEKPSHEIYLPPFYISKHLVTNSQYYRFLSSTENSSIPAYHIDNKIPPKKAGHPVVGITWYDAKEYANWVGGRLPTEAEWEKAASWEERKKQKRKFPWGPQFNSILVNTYESKIRDTSLVGSFSDGSSPYGLLDMSGNVWEWTSSLFFDYPYNANDGREDELSGGYRVVRGGSWLAPAESCYTSFRNGEIPKFFSVDLGFRVVIDIPK